MGSASVYARRAAAILARVAEASVEPAVDLRGLGKRFGGHVVLDGIDLAVARGTILGYIGPNGAGKSTTVKILCGLTPDFEGEARVLGLDPRADPLAVKRRIGYVPENAVLYELLTVAEFLRLVGRLHGLDDALVRRRAETFLEVFELGERLGARIQTLSKGMRQKVLLTSALLHDPELVFLDEPLSGLDVNATILVKELIRALAAAGKTVFYCSHVMDVVERVCDRIAILDGGKLVAQGSFEELQAARGGGSLEQIFARLTSAGGQEDAARRLVAALGDGA
jgi:ABC-2 type transport system ATP-binding protein